MESDPTPVLKNESVQELLTCGVCLEVLVNPVRGCNGNHHFCGDCLQKVVTSDLRLKTPCPQCREDVVFSKDRAGKQIAGVPAPMLSALIETQDCICPYDCGNSLKLKDLSEHKKVCENVPIECPFAALGCKHKGPRNKLDAHIEEAKNEHHMLIAKNLSTTHDIISNQNIQLHFVQCRIRNLTKEVADLRTEHRVAHLQVVRLCSQIASEQAITYQLLSKSLAEPIEAKRAPKRKAATLEEASNAANEVVVCTPIIPRRFVDDDSDDDKEEDPELLELFSRAHPPDAPRALRTGTGMAGVPSRVPRGEQSSTPIMPSYSPTYSPTSPTYSPTSPSYSPTSL
jgi:hypothetical protein